VGLRVAALAWGLAEATLFFVVPDVLLSAIAVRDRRLALRCCLWALVGALVGGTIMFTWANNAPDAALTAVDHVPAVTTEMVSRVESGLADIGSWALFVGPLTGTPYKLYAVLAPTAGIGLLTFLLISIPARLIRFVLVTLTISLVARWLPTRITKRTRLALLLSSWAVFYTLYFTVLT
jgi:membrane protein YqaA with SNARE-associated domain